MRIFKQIYVRMIPLTVVRGRSTRLLTTSCQSCAQVVLKISARKELLSGTVLEVVLLNRSDASLLLSLSLFLFLSACFSLLDS